MGSLGGYSGILPLLAVADDADSPRRPGSPQHSVDWACYRMGVLQIGRATDWACHRLGVLPAQ